MASKRTSKKSISKIPPKTAERIVAISLQHPELGARRLVPLLKKKRISVSVATVQGILRREDLQNSEKRLAQIKKRAKKTRKPRSPSKEPATPITDKVAERIVAISLQNPDFGAGRLGPLLEKEGIVASSSAVYRVLKRCGLQTREKRMAKAAKAVAVPVFIPKTFPKKIPPEVEDRIVELSLQNPDFGARRLTPLLQQEQIFISASAVYTILKRNNVENRQKRLLKLEDRVTPETPVAFGAEVPEPFAEPTEKESPAPGAEAPEPVFEPAVAAPVPPEIETPAPAEGPEPTQEPAVAEPPQPVRPHIRKALIKPLKKRSHWVFYPFYLLLIALIAYLGFNAVQTIQYARLDTEALQIDDSVTAGIAARTDASMRPLDGYRQIWQRNLFNTGKAGESDAEKKISLEKIAPAKKDLGLELVGTVVSDDPRLSRAIIDNRGIRKQEAYREGDKAGEARIKKILRNNVVITTAEGDELLTVEIKDSGSSAPSELSQRLGSRSASAPQAAGSQRAPARTLSLNLKRDEVWASLADIDKFMEQLTIAPYKMGDQPSGFMISRITPQNVLRKMGLRSRDVITAINDEAITGPEQAADFFERLSRGGEVTINLQRRRRNRQIKLNIE
jgi:general secretion pathway protein C